MIDLGKLEKDFEVDYSPEEGFKNLFIRRKVPNDLNAPLYLIFKGIPLTEAIAFQDKDKYNRNYPLTHVILTKKIVKV